MQSAKVCDALNKAMDNIFAAMSDIKNGMADITPDELRSGLRNFLVGWLQKAVSGDELSRRRVRLHCGFLIEQCAELLHDLSNEGRAAPLDKLIGVVDHAHDFTAQMINESPENFIRKYDSMIREVSFLDPKSKEEREARKRVIQANFGEFLKARANK